MNSNTDFIQNLFEKLSNIKNKNIFIKNETKKTTNGKNLKSDLSSTSETPKGDETPSSPGTPQMVDTKQPKEIKQENKKIPEKEKQVGEKQVGEVGEEQTGTGKVGQNGEDVEVKQRTDQVAGEVGRAESEIRGKFAHKNQKAQVGEDLSSVIKNQVLKLHKQQTELSAQKNARAEQVSYIAAEPLPPISKIRGERPIPFYSVVGIVALYTLPYIQRFVKNAKLKKRKKDKEEETSFFVPAYVMVRGIKIGECLVATESCDILNEKYNLNPKIEQFMVGEIVGIIDETVYQVTIRVFPNKRFVYTNGMTYLVPFVPFEEVNCPTGPRSDSPSSKLKKSSRQVVERYYDYYVKIKKSKYYQNVIKILNYEPYSSKK